MLNPWRHQAALEASKRRNRESTYTQPLGLEAASDDGDLKALQAFLKQFYPNFYTRKAEEARQAKLEEYPEVALFYESLVPNVISKEEFWQRLDYRCEESRIMAEWDRHPQRGRKVLGDAMSSWFDSQVQSVKSLVNGQPQSTKAVRTARSANDNETKKEEYEQKQKQPYVPPHKRKKDTTTKSKTQAYVPPHRRGQSGGKSAAPPVSLKGRAGSQGQATSNNPTQASSPRTTEATNVQSDMQPITDNAATPDSATAHDSKHKRAALVVLLFAVLVLPFLPRLVGMELSMCQSSSSLQMDRSWGQFLFCPKVVSTGLEPISFGVANEKSHHHKPNKRNKKKANRGDDDKSAGIGTYNDNHYGGQETGGLVESLISSWMQNTDIGQFAAQTTDLAQAEISAAQPNKGGLAGFFQRRFGGKQNHAPQMVVHQHIHHVVHHVVHEVRQS
ncbi:expressed unknown protein [Seminavis robusta]|uniref:BSD domain-containing protein n=1 Tax=Seminavis robusta TaxID=568900 RepID=A0A9N8D5Y3_9STRA|nr:expressed unknown protein [Seminavis robusta]|eukprot:Sro13_g009750.1 n/a (446) ;mRNA; r:20236-21573